MIEKKLIRLSEIQMDGGTQTRASLNNEAVTEYAEQMTNGAKFPAVVLFFDGSTYWLADGFHRCHASKQAGFLDILAEVRVGTRREAIKHAVQANQTGSVRRTNADKRKCVEIALGEFGDLSDRALAEMCGVSNKTVAAAREQVGNFPTSDIFDPIPQPAQTRKGRDGKEYPAPAPNQPKPEPEPDEEPQEESAAEPISPEEPAKQTKTQQTRDGLKIATKAIELLKSIHPDDQQRKIALKTVKDWVTVNQEI
jgi:hypothetical protein